MKNFNENIEVLSEKELMSIQGGYLPKKRYVILYQLAKDGWNAGRAFVRWAKSL